MGNTRVAFHRAHPARFGEPPSFRYPPPYPRSLSLLPSLLCDLRDFARSLLPSRSRRFRSSSLGYGWALSRLLLRRRSLPTSRLLSLCRSRCLSLSLSRSLSLSLSLSRLLRSRLSSEPSSRSLRLRLRSESRSSRSSCADEGWSSSRRLSLRGSAGASSNPPMALTNRARREEWRPESAGIRSESSREQRRSFDESQTG